MSDLFEVAEYAVAHGISLQEAEEICGDVLPADEADLIAEAL